MVNLECFQGLSTSQILESIDNPQTWAAPVGGTLLSRVACMDHHSSGPTLGRIKEATGQLSPLIWVQVYLCVTFALFIATKFIANLNSISVDVLPGLGGVTG